MSLRNHKAAIALFLTYYNMCRWHESLLRFTPAFAIGATDRVWGIENLVPLN